MVQRYKFSIELKNSPPDLSGEPLSFLRLDDKRHSDPNRSGTREEARGWKKSRGIYKRNAKTFASPGVYLVTYV